MQVKLDSNTVTIWTKVVTMWLWIGTGIGVGVVAVLAIALEVSPPEALIGIWLGALCALSGVGQFSYHTMRKTDYGALERQAAIEAAKTGSSPAGGAADG